MNKYNTFIAEEFSETTLQAKISEAQSWHSPHFMIHAHDFASALAELRSKEKEGYSFDDTFQPVMIPSGYGDGSGMYQVRLFKPTKVTKAELAEIATQATATYHAHLDSEKQRSIEAMTLRLIGEAEEKAAKQLEQARVKRLSEAREKAIKILEAK